MNNCPKVTSSSLSQFCTDLLIFFFRKLLAAEKAAVESKQAFLESESRNKRLVGQKVTRSMSLSVIM